MRRQLIEENIREALEIIGYDADAPAWPAYNGIVAPAPSIVEAVVKRLGWSPHNRYARIVVASTLQALMQRARGRVA